MADNFDNEFENSDTIVLYNEALDKDEKFFVRDFHNDASTNFLFIIQHDFIKRIINKLTDTQKRRIKYYYFDDLNFSEIARIEECDESSVRESIYSGINKLKKYLE